MGIHYHDLEIELDRNSSGDPEIRILRSTFDRPRAPFTFDPEHKKSIIAKVEEFDNLLAEAHPDDPKDLEKAQKAKEAPDRRRELADEIGMELYNVLLPGEIGRTCERSGDGLRSHEGLRLRLSFGGNYDHELGGLPWELICHPQTGRFISNNERYSVARYLDLGERIQPLDVEAPLKVLVVIASPDPKTSKHFEYSTIDKEPYRASLGEAIGQAVHLQVRFLHEVVDDGRVTLTALRDELKAADANGSPYHVVHIVCHGGFKGDEGILHFEREDGSEYVVTARALARRFPSSVRLVVLASCGTGKIPAPRLAGGHPFSGVASALVAKGMPAVVAMQFSVSGGAVAAFSEAFYRMIDNNEPIDSAVTEGRLAIESEGEEGMIEWVTPVLFLRAFDGKILKIKEGAPPKTVAIYNVLDHGKDKMRHVDFEVDLRDHFDERFLKPSSHWNHDILGELRSTLRDKVPGQSPIRFELAAPLSVAFAAGHLLPVKGRRALSVTQRDEVWNLKDPATTIPTWRDFDRIDTTDFPLTPGESDIAVVVEATRPAMGNVADYLRREDLNPPRIGHVIQARFDQYDHYQIQSGGHARHLASSLIHHIDKVALPRSYPTVHLFFAGPHGLALALGAESHELPRIQLYEFDFEKKRHKSYEPSIVLESRMSGSR